MHGPGSVKEGYWQCVALAVWMEGCWQCMALAV